MPPYSLEMPCASWRQMGVVGEEIEVEACQGFGGQTLKAVWKMDCGDIQEGMLSGASLSEPGGGCLGTGSLRTQVQTGAPLPSWPYTDTPAPTPLHLNFLLLCHIFRAACVVSGWVHGNKPSWPSHILGWSLVWTWSPSTSLSPVAQAGHPGLFWSPEALDQTICLYLRQELGPRLTLLAPWSRMCPPP